MTYEEFEEKYPHLTAVLWHLARDMDCRIADTLDVGSYDPELLEAQAATLQDPEKAVLATGEVTGRAKLLEGRSYLDVFLEDAFESEGISVWEEKDTTNFSFRDSDAKP